MVSNLSTIATKVDLILNELASYSSLPHRLSVLFICSTLINEAAGKDRIFVIVFLTLYPIGWADFNALRIWKVDLNDYARHLIYFINRRFG
jgi:hypothetical protein